MESYGGRKTTHMIALLIEMLSGEFTGTRFDYEIYAGGGLELIIDNQETNIFFSVDDLFDPSDETFLDIVGDIELFLLENCE